MGPVRTGRMQSLGSRTVAAADTAHPNASNPTAANIIRVDAVADVRSRDAWITVRNAAADVGVSVTVSVFASGDGTGTQADAGSWECVGQLNDGAAITPSTTPNGTLPAGIQQANRITWGEGFVDLLGWRYIYLALTGTVAQNVRIEVYGERGE